MFLNFCDPCLRPEIKCNAISTEGYEVTNLISNSCKGYLAYSCIKPPIHIDITFLCNVCLNHVLIWPAVGSQKSSGFQLYSRNIDNSIPYTLLSNGFLESHDAGLLFYSSDIDHTGISVPANFLRRYIKASVRHLTKSIHVLRITIYKTEKSVPALGKIEVWGTVSPHCRKDVIEDVHTLWAKHQAPLILPVIELKTHTTTTIDIRSSRLRNNATFEVPESFLDSITWELMTQPVILPSGKIIDQTTLEEHRKNEAIWGRPLSDPFTGLRFNNNRRPIIAAALKSRIDKFLLDNSNQNEIKKMPRVLGHDPALTITTDKRMIEVPKCVLNKNSLKRSAENIKPNLCKQINNDSQYIKRYCHKLPIAVMPKQPTANTIAKSKQFTKISTSSKLAHNNSQNHNRSDELNVFVNNIFLDTNLKTLLSNIKGTPEKIEFNNIFNKCDCCKNSIFYMLPCKHIMCRKVLLSIENNQCKYCGFFYKSSEIERIHDIQYSK